MTVILTCSYTHFPLDTFLKRPLGIVFPFLFDKASIGLQTYWCNACSVTDSADRSIRHVYRADESNKSTTARNDHYIANRNPCSDSFQWSIQHCCYLQSFGQAWDRRCFCRRGIRLRHRSSQTFPTTNYKHKRLPNRFHDWQVHYY